MNPAGVIDARLLSVSLVMSAMHRRANLKGPEC